ncbi:MAG: aerobic carbon-monoxide dehydrogenase small subunit [Solirubrobacteraceae bacterium]|jgi:carbon-monoxide dehydrogenase small subunit|nr:aerobic carbon-monoxide dehydrogenase small subunit [Solirubrobacteraceae bacterium]
MAIEATTHERISVTINGVTYDKEVPVRMHLVDFIRQEIGLTGTHVGCEQGVCGACTIEVNGEAVRSCLMFAVQVDGAQITTIEGVGPAPGQLGPIQESFRDHHALQCGFCTPGMVITAKSLLEFNASPSEDEIREAISGNICRCTGYKNIVAAVGDAAERVRVIQPSNGHR